MRILVVSSRFPHPPWRGNQVRTLQWLDALSDHDLGLVCPAPSVDDHASLLPTGVRLWPWRAGAAQKVCGLVSCGLAGRPLQEGLFDLPPARSAVGEALASGAWHLAVIQMVRCGWAVEVVRERAPGAAILFDAIDSMGLHYARAADAAPWPVRVAYRLEARRCRLREQRLAARADGVAAVSRRDLEALVGAACPASWLVPVWSRDPTGPRGEKGPPTVLLSGNLGYPPTIAAARLFADEVWPAVRAAVPAARWVLAGARPAASVRRLGDLPGVEVHADVPDLGRFVASATVAVAPMDRGSGVAMKVLEAWSAGVPVVADPFTADGLEADPAPGVATARTAREWVEALVRLLSDPRAADDLGRRGRAVWERRYSPERVADAIRTAAAGTVSGGRVGSSS